MKNEWFSHFYVHPIPVALPHTPVVFVSLKRCCSPLLLVKIESVVLQFEIKTAAAACCYSKSWERYGQLVHPLFSEPGSIQNLSRSSQKISGKPHLTKQIINRNRKLPTVVVVQFASSSSNHYYTHLPNTDYCTQKSIIGTNSRFLWDPRQLLMLLAPAIHQQLRPKIRGETLIILEDPQGIFLICFKAVFAGKKAEKIKIYVALVFLTGSWSPLFSRSAFSGFIFFVLCTALKSF